MSSKISKFLVTGFQIAATFAVLSVSAHAADNFDPSKIDWMTSSREFREEKNNAFCKQKLRALFHRENRQYRAGQPDLFPTALETISVDRAADASTIFISTLDHILKRPQPFEPSTIANLAAEALGKDITEATVPSVNDEKGTPAPAALDVVIDSFASDVMRVAKSPIEHTKTDAPLIRNGLAGCLDVATAPLWLPMNLDKVVQSRINSNANNAAWYNNMASILRMDFITGHANPDAEQSTVGRAAGRVVNPTARAITATANGLGFAERTGDDAYLPVSGGQNLGLLITGIFDQLFNSDVRDPRANKSKAEVAVDKLAQLAEMVHEDPNDDNSPWVFKHREIVRYLKPAAILVSAIESDANADAFLDELGRRRIIHRGLQRLFPLEVIYKAIDGLHDDKRKHKLGDKQRLEIQHKEDRLNEKMIRKTERAEIPNIFKLDEKRDQAAVWVDKRQKGAILDAAWSRDAKYFEDLANPDKADPGLVTTAVDQALDGLKLTSKEAFDLDSRECFTVRKLLAHLPKERFNDHLPKLNTITKDNRANVFLSAFNVLDLGGYNPADANAKLPGQGYADLAFLNALAENYSSFTYERPTVESPDSEFFNPEIIYLAVKKALSTGQEPVADQILGWCGDKRVLITPELFRKAQTDTDKTVYNFLFNKRNHLLDARDKGGNTSFYSMMINNTDLKNNGILGVTEAKDGWIRAARQTQELGAVKFAEVHGRLMDSYYASVKNGKNHGLNDDQNDNKTLVANYSKKVARFAANDIVRLEDGIDRGDKYITASDPKFDSLLETVDTFTLPTIFDQARGIDTPADFRNFIEGIFRDHPENRIVIQDLKRFLQFEAQYSKSDFMYAVFEYAPFWLEHSHLEPHILAPQNEQDAFKQRLRSDKLKVSFLQKFYETYAEADGRETQPFRRNPLMDTLPDGSSDLHGYVLNRMPYTRLFGDAGQFILDRIRAFSMDNINFLFRRWAQTDKVPFLFAVTQNPNTHTLAIVNPDDKSEKAVFFDINENTARQLQGNAVVDRNWDLLNAYAVYPAFQTIFEEQVFAMEDHTYELITNLGDGKVPFALGTMFTELGERRRLTRLQWYATRHFTPIVPAVDSVVVAAPPLPAPPLPAVQATADTESDRLKAQTMDMLRTASENDGIFGNHYHFIYRLINDYTGADEDGKQIVKRKIKKLLTVMQSLTRNRTDRLPNDASESSLFALLNTYVGIYSPLHYAMQRAPEIATLFLEALNAESSESLGRWLTADLNQSIQFLNGGRSAFWTLFDGELDLDRTRNRHQNVDVIRNKQLVSDLYWKAPGNGSPSLLHDVYADIRRPMLPVPGGQRKEFKKSSPSEIVSSNPEMVTRFLHGVVDSTGKPGHRKFWLDKYISLGNRPNLVDFAVTNLQTRDQEAKAATRIVAKAPATAGPAAETKAGAGTKGTVVGKITKDPDAEKRRTNAEDLLRIACRIYGKEMPEASKQKLTQIQATVKGPALSIITEALREHGGIKAARTGYGTHGDENTALPLATPRNVPPIVTPHGAGATGATSGEDILYLAFANRETATISMLFDAAERGENSSIMLAYKRAHRENKPLIKHAIRNCIQTNIPTAGDQQRPFLDAMAAVDASAR